MPSPSLDSLETFVTIARLRGFARARTVLHCSQPAISRRIALLEAELGARLFDRVSGGVVLTDAGTALLPHAEAALAAIRDGAAAVRDVIRDGGGHVSLAVVGTLANAQLVDRLKRFRRRHAKVRVELRTATSAEVSELVRRGDATFGLRYGSDDSADMVSRTITHEPVIVVAAADHRLADGKRHAPTALAGERWVTFPARTSRETYVELLARTLVAAGIDAPDIIAIDSLTAQKRFVEAGFGIAMFARSHVDDELRLGTLAAIEIPALRAKIPVAIVHRKHGYLSTAARELLTELTT